MTVKPLYYEETVVIRYIPEEKVFRAYAGASPPGEGISEAAAIGNLVYRDRSAFELTLEDIKSVPVETWPKRLWGFLSRNRFYIMRIEKWSCEVEFRSQDTQNWFAALGRILTAAAPDLGVTFKFDPLH